MTHRKKKKREKKKEREQKEYTKKYKNKNNFYLYMLLRKSRLVLRLSIYTRLLYIILSSISLLNLQYIMTHNPFNLFLFITRFLPLKQKKIRKQFDIRYTVYNFTLIPIR